MKFHRVVIDEKKCRDCKFCQYLFNCPSPNNCIGCLACVWACPYEARKVVEVIEDRRRIRIYVDSIEFEVPENITVAKALELIGYKFKELGSREPSLACRVGGCWSCALIIDGSVERACITPVRDGMKICTDFDKFEPLRIIHGPEPHLVGGKGTPWWEVDYVHYVECAIWVAGCNLRCPQCQNYSVTYDNSSTALTAKEAAALLALCQRDYNTKGVAISGGEPTINRRWLVEFFKWLKKYVSEKVRKHLDSNGTILKPDYIDELVEAGCNDFGVEPKCLHPDTYMRITGLNDRELAVKYLETSWKAIEYLYENYSGKVFLGIGVVYNNALVSLDEIAEVGRRIVSIDPNIQVTVLDYFPAFRRRNIERPSVQEMLRVKKLLEDQGLRNVIVQTRIGHFGPGDRRVPS
ncbi:MAG: radical SAM protein [Thermoprotei archaeon ex4572_64]|nr:MAG: radical SAM protein [Thermoprotei archaeon ex4572_64]